MRRVLFVAAALAFSASEASAEFPKPSCYQLKTAYETMTKKPFHKKDGLVVVANALADNKLLPDFKSTEYRSATRAQALEFVKFFAQHEGEVVSAVMMVSMIKEMLDRKNCQFRPRVLEIAAD